MFTIFPELVRCAWAKEEERLATLTHRYFGSGNPLKSRAEYEEMLSKAGIALRYEPNVDSLGALIVKEDQGQVNPMFCVKEDLEWVEQRFLIARLLGRFLFDYQVKLVCGSSKISEVKETRSPYQRYLLCKRPRPTQLRMHEMEWLADEFAGALLLPKQWLRKFVEEEKDPLLIAAHFSISLDFLHARVKHIRQRNLEHAPSSLPYMGKKVPFKRNLANPVSSRARD